MADRIVANSQRSYARFAGFMYLFVLAFDIAGLLIVSRTGGAGSFVETSHRIMDSEQLYRIGLCCSLVGSVSTVPLAIGLYVAVKPVDANLAMMALLLRIVEAATGAVAVIIGFAVLRINLAANHANAFDPSQLGALADLTSRESVAGTGVASVFFSLGSALFFYLFLESRYIPRILPAWGIFASLVYTAVWFVSLILPQYSATLVLYGLLPILVAELSTALWLLIVGIRIQPKNLNTS
jgi:hypothetical protein